MKHYKQLLIWASLIFYSPSLWAAHRPGAGYGRVAENLMDPVNILADFVVNACFVIGACFLFAAVIRYFQYRANRLAHPLSTVFVLFILGILLFLLPFTKKLLEMLGQ